MEPTPTIERLEWGRVHTSVGAFRDGKLWPGGGRGWDWDETGTRHVPGVQGSDVAELLDHAPDVVVIGRGQRERLQVTAEARAAVDRAGVRLEVHESSVAVTRHNQLVAEGVAVATLVHSTC